MVEWKEVDPMTTNVKYMSFVHSRTQYKQVCTVQYSTVWMDGAFHISSHSACYAISWLSIAQTETVDTDSRIFKIIGSL